MTYDHWKTTNPDDEELGPEPVDPEAEMEHQLDLIEDRENEEERHPAECAWESPY